MRCRYLSNYQKWEITCLQRIELFRSAYARVQRKYFSSGIFPTFRALAGGEGSCPAFHPRHPNFRVGPGAGRNEKGIRFGISLRGKPCAVIRGAVPTMSILLAPRAAWQGALRPRCIPRQREPGSLVQSHQQTSSGPLPQTKGCAPLDTALGEPCSPRPQPAAP
jgi:hypothetical protein